MRAAEAKRAILGLALALLAPGAGLAAAPGGDPVMGAAVFQDRCVGCHALSGTGQGPSLFGVVGRRAGAAPGFNYSAALQASGLTRTAPKLDRFLQGPTKLVPGTAMRAVVADPGDRGDLIAYLATLKPGAR